MQDAFNLNGSDLRWFNAGPTAIGASERCALLGETLRMAHELKESAPGTTTAVILDQGTVLHVAQQNGGKVLVRITDTFRDLYAKFSFKLGDDSGSRQVSISDLRWELDATRNATPLEALDLTVETVDILKRGDIHTLGELRSRTDDDLLDIQPFLVRHLLDVEEMLANCGLSLSK